MVKSCNCWKSASDSIKQFTVVYYFRYSSIRGHWGFIKIFIMDASKVAQLVDPGVHVISNAMVQNFKRIEELKENFVIVNNKNEKWIILKLFFFMFIGYLGPMAIVLLVLFVQIKCFHEVNLNHKIKKICHFYAFFSEF